MNDFNVGSLSDRETSAYQKVCWPNHCRLGPPTPTFFRVHRGRSGQDSQTRVVDKMAAVLEKWSKRFLGALDETIKHTPSSSRAITEIKNDVRRIERKVSTMTRAVDDALAVDGEPRGKESMRSVV